MNRLPARRARNADAGLEVERILTVAHRVMDQRGYPLAPSAVAPVYAIWGWCDLCGVALAPSDEWPLCSPCMLEDTGA